ncbi:MAG: hypothetical protein KDA29_03050 [Phycisphaerales bacterium]|nr:hypothetical protein [Phycisphaerales bacterium]
MRWYSSHIDPAIPLDTKARWRLHKAAWSRWYKDPINWVIYAIGLAISLGIFIFLPDIIQYLTGYDSWPILALSLLIYALLLVVLYLIMRATRFAPCVYAELRERGFDVCVSCGYWLRDLDEGVDRCPECGKARVLQSEPTQHPANPQ